MQQIFFVRFFAWILLLPGHAVPANLPQLKRWSFDGVGVYSKVHVHAVAGSYVRAYGRLSAGLTVTGHTDARAPNDDATPQLKARDAYRTLYNSHPSSLVSMHEHNKRPGKEI